MDSTANVRRPQRERKRRLVGKGTYHLISAYKPRSFLKSWGRPAGGGLSAAYKRVKAMIHSKKVLSAHFCLKPHPPGADFNSTLSAQRNTGSASNKNTVARKKLLAQRRRREGVYNRAAGASVTFSGGADARERADGPRTGDRSIADFASARAAAEFRY